MEMQGKKVEYRGMTYHYAMSAFYRIDKNPNGPSHRPIMTIVLEWACWHRCSAVKLAAIWGWLFTGEIRLNLGEYEGDTSPQAVKRRFFEILGHQLGLSGQPKMIGNLAQVHGHPDTGLPAKKKNSGCAPVILLCIGIGGLGIWGLSFI